MSDDTHCDDPVREISVSLPEPVVEELIEAYPAATRGSEAIRMAIQADLERRREQITPATIRDSVVAALEESGGSWHSLAKLEIGEAESIEVDDAGNVTIETDDGE